MPFNKCKIMTVNEQLYCDALLKAGLQTIQAQWVIDNEDQRVKDEKSFAIRLAAGVSWHQGLGPISAYCDAYKIMSARQIG
jgi:hypothetical protein